ncbi:MAG: DUF1634 domain-containing protein [Planctomycetota bacterium]|nr:DUF1634 domain-containing protein [Planctomycetota bacterium]
MTRPPRSTSLPPDPAPPPNPAPQRRLEARLANILTVATLLAASILLIGALLHLTRPDAARPSYAAFTPASPSTLRDLFAGLSRLDPRAIMQLGVVLLVLTPVARVITALVSFALRRDRLYVVVSLIVLGALLAGLLGVRV